MEKTKGKIGKEQKGVKRRQKREQGGGKNVKRICFFNGDFFLKNKFIVLEGFAKDHNLSVKGHNLFDGFSLAIFWTFQ